MKELNKKKYCKYIKDCGGCEECTLCASYDVDLDLIEFRKQEIIVENKTVINAYKNPEAKKELDFLNNLKEETQPKRNKKVLIDKYNKAIENHSNYIKVLEVLKNNVDQKFNNKVYNKRFNDHLSELLENTNYRIYKIDRYSYEENITFTIYPKLQYSKDKILYLNTKQFLPDEGHKRIDLEYFKNELQKNIDKEKKQIAALERDKSNLLVLSKKYKKFIELQEFFNHLNYETSEILNIQYNFTSTNNTLLNIE